MSLFLGIDCGTQSTKAVVLDPDARRLVAEAQAPHTLIEGLPQGHAEQHPKEWIAALELVLAMLASQIDTRRIRGIGISAQQHGFVPLDGDGQVIRPAKLWCDTSTSDECHILTEKLGGTHAVIEELGLPILPGYTASKILWLKRHEAHNYRLLRHVLLPHNYLNFHLTGNYHMEHGDASGTALMNVRTRHWASKVIEAIDPELTQYLPALSASDRPAGTLRPELAQTYGLPSGVIVSAGGGDNMMSAIGTGAVTPGVLTVSLGTSGTLFAYSTTPMIDPRGEIASFCDSTGAWLPLLCTMNLGRVTDHIRALFGWGQQEFESAIASAPAGADGLRFTPHLAGERTPNLPHSTGTLQGITHRNLNPPCLARAALEGITYGLRYCLHQLREQGLVPQEARLTGGGARSPTWRQTIADIFGIPVVKVHNDESAALGAALQAAWCSSAMGLGTSSNIAELSAAAVQLDESTRCIPDSGAHELYSSIATLVG